MHIEIIRDPEKLTPLRAAWNDVAVNSNFDSVFASHEWFQCWTRHFARDKQAFIVIARDGDDLLGIMPLLLEQHRRGPFKRTILRSMTNQQTYKFNFVVSNNRASEVLQAMFAYLSQELSWTDMILDFVPATNDNIPLFESLQGKAFYRMRSEFHMDSPYTPITGSWDEYLTQRDKKTRKNLDYFERKLDKAGKVNIISIHGNEALGQNIDQALNIEQSSWKGNNGTAIADSHEETGFYHELGQTMAARGEFCLHFLTLDNQPIAFDYCLTHNDRFNVLKTGYNPAFAKLSPGRVLRKKLLRQLYDEGVYKVYDLLGARDAWKMEWCKDSETLLHLHFYNRRPTAVLNCELSRSAAWCKARLNRYPRAYHAVKALYLWSIGLFAG